MDITDASFATEFTRVYLAAFYSFVALFYTSRILLSKRANSTEVVFPGARFCKTWWNHMTFRVFRVTIWGICVLRLVLPSTDQYLGLIVSLQSPAVIFTGDLLLAVGFASTALINMQLGAEWRSGIDPNAPRKLITHGWYRFSRNPMFLCVAVSQLGFFLALPSYFSLVCLGFGLYTLYSQTLEEEKHLHQTHGEHYTLYTTQVRRWV